VEPLTIASAFATIVGLLGTYRSERRSQSSSLAEFLDWLKEHRFEDLAAEIQKNGRASTSIEAMMRENYEVLLQRLERIDRTLAFLASRFEGVGQLALALRAEDALSESAVSLLSQVETAGVDAFWISYAGGRPPVPETTAGRFEYGEPRFLEVDLATMVELGLLRPGRTSKGEPLYRFTRAASNFVRDVQTTGSNQSAPPGG
jgi:hypothetical protein